MIDMPKLQPRKIDDHVTFHPSVFVPFNQRPHDERVLLKNRGARICGKCHDLIPIERWQAHKEYCWDGGTGVRRGSPTWFKGCHKNGQPKIIDPNWARGDRDLKR